MLSRRSFVGGACVLSCAPGTTRAGADERSDTIIDLDFIDRSAEAVHASVFGDRLRYVDHEVFGDPAGIVVEDGVCNGVEDAAYAGTPHPSGWQMVPDFVPSPGYVATFDRVGPAQGRLRLQGASACDCYVILGSARYYAVEAGDLLTGSLAISLSDGKVETVTGVGLIVLENDTEGKISNVAPRVAQVQQLQRDKPWWAQASIVVGERGFANLVLKVATAGHFDLTFAVNYPQLEKRAWRSTFCPRSRNPDVIEMTDPSAYLSQIERSIIVTADAPRYVAEATLWSETADARNHVEIQYRDHAIFAQVVTDGVVNEIRLGVVPPLMRFTICLIQRASGFTASLNGKGRRDVECAMPRRLRSITLGDGTHGKWNSTVARLSLHRSALVDGEIVSRQDIAFYDDFDRPDSETLGRSPTGQTIECVGSNRSAIEGRRWVAIAGGEGPAFAAYGKVRLDRTPRYLGAVIVWTVGDSGGAAGLLSATNDMSGPTDALHGIVSDTAEIFQTVSNSRVDGAMASFVYSVASPRDGRTPDGVACMLNIAENAVVYISPQGDLVRHVSALYARRAGRVAVFEHFWQTHQCRPEFLAVAAAS